MGTLLTFPNTTTGMPPVPPIAAPPVLAPDRPTRTMTTHELASRLGMGDTAPRTVISRLRAMVSLGLPLPINPRQWQGKIRRGPDAICWGSRWDRGQALAFLDRWLGDADASHEENRQEDVRAKLQARAANLLRRTAGAGQ